MEEVNNQIKRPNLESVGFIQKSAVGAHSYTFEETKTMTYLDTEILKRQIRGENLELKNDGKSRYFLVENGIVFKYSQDTGLFYQLDLETMTWRLNQRLVSIYYDTYLRFQELLSFKDYYDMGEQMDLDSGRHL